MTDEDAQLELDYWRLLLDDVELINTSILEAVSAVADIPLYMVETMVGTPQAAQQARMKASRSSREAIDVLARMQPAVGRIVTLVGGRVKVLQGSIGEGS